MVRPRIWAILLYISEFPHSSPIPLAAVLPRLKPAATPAARAVILPRTNPPLIAADLRPVLALRTLMLIMHAETELSQPFS